MPDHCVYSEDYLMDYIFRTIASFQIQSAQTPNELGLITDTGTVSTSGESSWEGVNQLAIFGLMLLVLLSFGHRFMAAPKPVNDGRSSGWDGRRDDQPDAGSIN